MTTPRGRTEPSIADGPSNRTGPSAPARPTIAAARRLVVKVGSSSLTTADGSIDSDRVAVLADAFAEKIRAGADLILVSSGAIAAGIVPLGLPSRPRDLATQQAAASVGQGLLIARYAAAFARHDIGVGQVLLSADDLMRRAHYRNAQRTLDRLLELHVLPIVNENDTVATDEIRFGDNDRLAALVAHVTRAGALILLSDVDGLYDSDPRKPGAHRITEVRGPADLEGVRIGGGSGAGIGTGGMTTKVDSARIATGAGIPTVVASAADAAAGAGRRTGRHLLRRHRPAPATRLLWLAHAAVAARHGSTLDQRRGRRRDRPPRLAAARRHHQGRRHVRGRRPGGPVRRRRQRGRPRPGQLRRGRDPRPDGPLHPLARPRARPRNTSARSSTATTWSCSSVRSPSLSCRRCCCCCRPAAEAAEQSLARAHAPSPPPRGPCRPAGPRSGSTTPGTTLAALRTSSPIVVVESVSRRG